MTLTPGPRFAVAAVVLVAGLVGAGGFVAGRVSAPEPPTPPVGYADDVEAGDFALGPDPTGGPRLETRYVVPLRDGDEPIDPTDDVATSRDAFARGEVTAATAGDPGGGDLGPLLSAVAVPGTTPYLDALERLRRREGDPVAASSGVRRLVIARPVLVGDRLYRVDACRDDRDLVAPPDPSRADPTPTAAPGTRVAVRYHLLRVVLLGQVSSPWRVADAVVLRDPDDERRICEPPLLPR